MSRNLIRGRRGIAITIAAAVLVGVSVYWASQPEQPVEPQQSVAVIEARVTPRAAALQEARSAQRDAAGPEAVSTLPGAAGTSDTEVATVAHYVSEKYEFLFGDAHYLRAEQIERLHELLLARELRAEEVKSARTAGAVAGDDLARRERALAEVEDQIRRLLHPADYATYEALKESDAELFHLQQYAGGISNVAPLSTEERKSIMKTKLAYKSRYRQALRDSGLERDNLSPTEREYAYSAISRAMQDFKSSYLKEVRQYLVNEEQYVLLSNYENTEFTAELAKLRAMADSH